MQSQQFPAISFAPRHSSWRCRKRRKSYSPRPLLEARFNHGFFSTNTNNARLGQGNSSNIIIHYVQLDPPQNGSCLKKKPVNNHEDNYAKKYGKLLSGEKMIFYQQYLESHLGPTLRPSSFPKGSVYGIFTCIWHYGKCRWIDHTWILWLGDHSGNFRKTWKLFFRSHEMINPLCTNKEHLVLFRENLWRNLSYFRYQVSPEIGDRTTKELPFPDDPCKE